MSKWIAFSDQEPPIDSALDDDSIKVNRIVLVTNNIKAKDRMGNMSHVWYERPIRIDQNNEWMAFSDAGRKIHGLTHWFDPGINNDH